jgi:RNase H-like domain found in reverse transcriptase/Reverse transcriptase (RNA-dependent DNA polymerase)/Integrase zinc binding domain/Integrase core domain
VVASVLPDYKQLVAEYPSVVNASKKMPPVKHKVEHYIITDGPPETSKYRRLDPDRLAAAKAEFEELERQGVVRKSSSNWASPLHMVRKPDGSWRPCGDFRKLNLITKEDKYTCPNIGDLTARLAGCTVFSKLDLRKGYYQVPVRPEHVCKTAIITPFGLYEFLRMPFGLRNAGQTFQRMMDDVMAGLPFCFIYLDDILVASPDHVTHVQHLREVLQRLSDHGLVINAEKCLFGVREIDYLGHRISSSGIRPLQDRLTAISNYPQPKTVQQLQTYLGMVNFYRKFFRGAAAVLRPLTEALRGGQHAAISWTAEMAAAFQASKEALMAATELAHPQPGAEISLAVDASGTHVGAVLQQHVSGGGVRPLGFYSAKLEAAQQKYSAFDRELLACYLAVRHFRWMLEGRKFCIFSDHKPLTFALHRTSDAWSARQQRHLSYVAEYTSDIRHVPGKNNNVADALSRPAAAVAPATCGVDFQQLAAAQRVCSETAELATCQSLHVQKVVVNNVELLCDVSNGLIRPLVPNSFRQAVFQSVHQLAHPGTRATRRMVSTRFVWRGMAADIAAWCRDCQGCARGKILTHVKSPVQKIPVPAARFSHVHVDIVGPLPTSAEGHTHLLTMIDRTTRWPEVVPLRSISAAECADAFTSGWIARFGVPATVTTDRGTQFTSAVWSCLCRTLNINHVTTSAYHPQSNGMIERFHRQLKQSLKARQCGTAWAEHVPWVLLGLRAAPKEDSSVSAAEAVYGEQLVIPHQLKASAEVQPSPSPSPPPEPPTVAEPTTSSGVGPRSYAEVAATPYKQLQAAEYVYVRRGNLGGPLSPPYSGPYRVLSRREKIFEVQVGGRTESISVDRLKPHRGEAPVVPAAPPARGRPPGTGGKIKASPVASPLEGGHVAAVK